MHRNIGRAGDGTTFGRQPATSAAPRFARRGMNRLGCLNPRLQTRQQQRDFGSRHCFAEKKSLYLHASFSAQNFKLFLGLDPLRGGDHAQAGTEPHDGADNGHAIIVFAEFADEGSSILILSNGKLRKTQ